MEYVCDICFEHPTIGDIQYLSCLHYICKQCYSQLRSPSCPFCRRDIDIVSIPTRNKYWSHDYSDIDEAAEIDIEIEYVSRRTRRRQRSRRRRRYQTYNHQRFQAPIRVTDIDITASTEQITEQIPYFDKDKQNQRTRTRKAANWVLMNARTHGKNRHR